MTAAAAAEETGSFLKTVENVNNAVNLERNKRCLLNV